MKNFDNIRLKVKWRGGFADRSDIFPISVDIQKESLDDRVRTRIYNEFMKYYEEKESIYSAIELTNFFLQEFYLTDLEYERRYNNGTGKQIFLSAVRDTIYKDHWANVFTFIEFWNVIVTTWKYKYSADYKNFEKNINRILEMEFVGYRLIDSRITPITDDVETKAIEEVLKNPHSEVKIHISKALEKLSDRENPDYKNSIKESISSVEAMARIITEKDDPTLGQALNQLEKQGVNIHPALKKSFQQLYGYTSDSSGIRHSEKIGGQNSTFEEAKFMLVACSAFNNYLLANTSE